MSGARPRSPVAGLAVEAVSHNIGALPILDRVSFDVASGELACLLGPSGCGKSTVLRLIAGLDPLQAGEIVIDDQVVARRDQAVPAENRGVGLVFQDIALFPHLTVLDNVAFGLARMTARPRRSIAEAALARVGMADRAGDYPHMLSGGEQQRVALARAMAPQPRVILLDEPFSGLDVNLRARVRADTAAILRQTGTTALIVTHDPEEAMLMADRIAVMRDGMILQMASPDEVYRNPKTAFCARFFGEVNRLAGRVRAGTVATRVGRFAAPGLAEGEPAQVLIRPEAVRLRFSNTDTGVIGTVTDVRRLGAWSQVTVTAEGLAAPLQARTQAQDPVRPGERWSIVIDQAMTFVFPDTDR